MKKLFRPEFLNRIDSTIVFSALAAVQVREIIDLLLKRVQTQLTEQRMTLEVTLSRAEGPPRTEMAVNEAVLQRTAAGHTVRLATCINGGPFVTYSADGLIVSTPTGSTAYNLSARGPIVSPRLRSLVVTAVSPHMLFNLPLVLDDQAEVRLDVLDGRVADLVVDGQPVATLGDGDSVSCRAGAHDALLVHYAPREFLGIVQAKFGLMG